MGSIQSVVLVVGALVGVCGCGPTYYRVTDPTPHRSYFTTEMREKGAGSVQLRDAGTGRTVTLQNSEIQKVTKEEFEAGKVRSMMGEQKPAGTDPR